MAGPTPVQNHYTLSKLSPVVVYRNAVEVYLDKRTLQPIVRIGGKHAKRLFRILAERFLTTGPNEVAIPITALPAITVWLIACTKKRPNTQLLDKLLYRTPIVLANLVWDIAELCNSPIQEPQTQEVEPLITETCLERARRAINELLKLYGYV